MHDARVLVVDDSAAMRALFSDVLEQSRNISVIGTAANAIEARKQIAALNPNVLTLDVEMPGMSGIEFLEEIMESNPLPVVMLSSLTQRGTDTSLRAFELGAVECFPKPLKATPEQFAKTVGKLGKIVLAAANSNVRARQKNAQRALSTVPFDWNGQIIAINASMGGIDALTTLLSAFPANCPPTIIVLQTEPELADAFVAQMAKDSKCSVRIAKAGASLTQGIVHIAADPSRHVVFEAGQPPKIRLLEREPVEGCRPSANLLYGMIARAGVPAVGLVLTGMGEDGARGLKLMRDAGCHTLAQEAASAMVGEAPAAAVAAGGVQREIELSEIATALLAVCSMFEAPQQPN